MSNKFQDMRLKAEAEYNKKLEYIANFEKSDSIFNNEILPKLQDILTSEGFGTIYVTTMFQNEEFLRINLTAPFTTFKGYVDQGYDQRGRGRNRHLLNAKAKKNYG